MSEKSYSVREVTRGIRKLTDLYARDNTNGFERRQGKEKWGWYYVDGEEAFFISSKLPPRGNVSRGRIHAMRKQMNLNREQFEKLCQCSLSGPAYHDLILAMVEAGDVTPGRGRLSS